VTGLCYCEIMGNSDFLKFLPLCPLRTLRETLT
jgi:hypothetical protein